MARQYSKLGLQLFRQRTLIYDAGGALSEPSSPKGFPQGSSNSPHPFPPFYSPLPLSLFKVLVDRLCRRREASCLGTSPLSYIALLQNDLSLLRKCPQIRRTEARVHTFLQA